ncbi:DUF1667 domain-containing protein [Haloimpatiens massiliensis]|uniref:DUF1667 domain-containing protein n=1 Tax=Haloimpatiens massiliensis TaxID=1658110 RepID=UPI000C83C3EC|nr:DUF1667 domain-containing protein [Haloimpatiens massiliensis]
MKKLVCIVCPNGCNLTIEGDKNNWVVSGNKCKRGEAFAINELTNPMRTICTTVKTNFKNVPVLPVRVSSDIPKDMIFKVMEEINKVIIMSPIGRGDVVIKDVLGLKVDVIATSNILKDTTISKD